MSRTTNGLIAAFALMSLSGAAAAGTIYPPIYLVGAQLYSSDANGATDWAAYQHSTNSGTSHAAFPIDLVGDTGGAVGTSIAVGLSLGTNEFTWSAFWPREFHGLNLLFALDGVPFNPAAEGEGIPGDLTVYARTDDATGGFQVPSAGTHVGAYNTDSNYYFPFASANGAEYLWLGDYLITIDGFSAMSVPELADQYADLAGRFSVLVEHMPAGVSNYPPSAVPLPGTLPLMASALLGAARRRGRAEKAARA